ncbi:MAG TPA: prepilin-type N-terminal cleavage/methylation domain-containing protein [Gammaproteobacteria bacterium]|nr:prepilin-type N-terminal cleavage/methylation domain-containing protein [Gammaproteobacteria bacterium]
MPLTHKNSRGFTLVELLVSLVLGLIVLGGVAAVMNNSKKNYEVQDYRSRMQENARFALQFLTYDIRMAGYTGYLACGSVSSSSWQFIWGATSPNDGDTITTQYVSLDYLTTTLPALAVDVNSGPIITLNDTSSFAEEDYVIITDCANTEVKQIKHILSGNRLQFETNLTNSYTVTNQTQVRRLQRRTYQVFYNTTRSIPVLIRIDAQGNKEELVEGIEFLRFLFAEDSNGNGLPNSYVAPHTPSNPVKGVKLALLTRSISNYNPGASAVGGNNQGGQFGTSADVDNSTYTLLDQTVDPATLTVTNSTALRVKRQVYQTTIKIRN